MSAKRVLVTGATGFVGAHAVPALEQRGFEVHALGRRLPSGGCGARSHPVDLLDAPAVLRIVEAIGASHLLHLAWYAEPGLYWRSALNLDWVGASLTLVRAFRECGGQRVVAAGTCAEYAWGPQRLREDAPCAPSTLYGVAKDSTRRVLEAYAAETSLSFAWGRLFFVYGPGEKAGRLVSDATRALRSGIRFGTSPGLQRRDFSFVIDVADAFAALTDSKIAGPINIGSGDAVSVAEILQTIGHLTGQGHLIDFGARALSICEPDLIEADVLRLQKELNFRPRYDLERGLREMLAQTA